MGARDRRIRWLSREGAAEGHDGGARRRSSPELKSGRRAGGVSPRVNRAPLPFHIISGALCASLLTCGGVTVTVFESGQGPGGQMSQRRETTGNGEELFFDHGAPYFTVSQGEVMGVVGSWEARGLVAEWKERFGSFDKTTGEFACIAKKWYCLSKTMAESEAVDYGKKHALDVVTVCPKVIFGPLLQSTVNTTSLFLINILKGVA